MVALGNGKTVTLTLSDYAGKGRNLSKPNFLLCRDVPSAVFDAHHRRSYSSDDYSAYYVKTK